MVYPPNWLSAPLNRLSSTVNAVTVRTLPPHSTHPSKTTLLLSELPVYFRNPAAHRKFICDIARRHPSNTACLSTTFPQYLYASIRFPNNPTNAEPPPPRPLRECDAGVKSHTRMDFWALGFLRTHAHHARPRCTRPPRPGDLRNPPTTTGAVANRATKRNTDKSAP